MIPSSADLEDFRALLDTDRPSGGGITTWHPVHGAWPHEKKNGIGFRVAPTPTWSWNEDPMGGRATEARRGASAMRAAAFERMALPEREVVLRHSLDDAPRVCWGCIDDAANAPEAPMGEHDPELHGWDEDGPFCVCGHHLVWGPPMP